MESKEVQLSVLDLARRRKLHACMEATDSRFAVCAQLIDEGLLDGWVYLDVGQPLRILDARITISGRELLEELDEVDGPPPMMWRSLPFVYGKGLTVAGVFMLLIAICSLAVDPNGGVPRKVQNISVTHQPNSYLTSTVGVCGLGPVE